MRVKTLCATVFLTAFALAGCSGNTARLPAVLRAAPEPAVAPIPDVTPAGTVVDLHVDEPEGIVVAPDGTAAIAARRPGALLLLAASTLGPVRTVPVPGAARHLELSGSDVLVPGEDTDIVSTVSLPGGSILTEAVVGRQPHDLADVDGTLVVADELGHAVSAVNTKTGAVTTESGPVQPGGVAASDGLVGVVDVRGRVLDVYTPTLRLVAQVPVGAGPTHAIDLGGGLLAVADTTGGRVYVVRVTGTPAAVSSVGLPGRPYGLAVDPDRHLLYVATGGDNTLHSYLVSGNTLRALKNWPTVRQPNSLAVVPDTHRILVVGATPDGMLQAIDP